MEIRRCFKCDVVKDVTAFYKSRIGGGAIGRKYHCKTYCAAIAKVRRRESPSPSHTKDERDRRNKKIRTENPAQWMLYATRASAKKRGLGFDLTIGDFIIPQYCPYLGIRIALNVGKGKPGTSPSVDRIDNSKGYIKGNVQIISDMANAMKRNATIGELVVFAQNILKLHSKEA